MSANPKTRGPLTSTPSTSSSVAAKPFSRGNSTQARFRKHFLSFSKWNDRNFCFLFKVLQEQEYPHFKSLKGAMLPPELHFSLLISTRNVGFGQIFFLRQEIFPKQETLSKDEARRRMLSWRKTTKLRKTSGSESSVAAATASASTATGNGSKRAKETRPVRRIASSAAAPVTSTADDS